MLIAKNQDGNMVSLYNLTDVELASYKACTYYCPCCNGKLYIKAGKIKIPHFAHAVHEGCNYASEGESEEHLQGKKHLYEWLSKQGEKVEMEKYFPLIKQRADLYLECQAGNIAVEYQCSILSFEEIKKRTQAYKKANIIPVWILSYRHLKRRGAAYSLSTFHWYAATGSYLTPRLLFYSPTLQEFTLLNQLTPFSARQTLGFPLKIKQKDITFNQLREPSNMNSLPYRDWMSRKKRWRLSSLVHGSISDTFYNTLYQTGFSPATMPNEIGIPVPYIHLYETSCIQWQFWLYVYVMKDKDEGEQLLLQEIRSAIIRCIREKKIKLRFMPFRKSVDPILPATCYLSLLVRLGVLEGAGDGNYMLVRKMQPYNPSKPEVEPEFFRMVCNAYDEIMKTEKEA